MKTLLVTMPWGQPTEPSYLMGRIHGLLEEQGRTEVRSFSYFLSYANFIAEDKHRKNEPFSLSDYQSFIGNYGLGDWIFAVPPFREYSADMDADYFRYLTRNGVKEQVIEGARDARELVPGFLSTCQNEVVSQYPNLVIFLPMYRECVPSLALARMVKQHSPMTKILFSGPVCDGPVGAGLLTSFDWIDLVIRDNPEEQIPAFIDHMSMDTGEFAPSGFCYRGQNDECSAIDQAPDNRLSVDNASLPSYDEYFERLKNSIIEPFITRNLWISYSASAGCWWAERARCSFCALTGTKRGFISKNPDTVKKELLLLAQKHKHLKFHMFDWIVDPSYISTLYRSLGREDVDLTLYLQTRSHLSKEDLAVLKGAGATLQIGVESLSTRVLRLLRKGTTALQNIRLLKWCAELNIKADWNILYNIPGEPTDEYYRMIETARSLVHLAPPRMNRFRLHPLSPYFESPNLFSIDVEGPMLWYYYVYSDVSADALWNIAEEFEFNRKHHQTEGADHVVQLRKFVDYWISNSNDNYRQLVYRNGPGFLQISDNRKEIGPNIYTLDELEAKIYRFCDNGPTSHEIHRFLLDEGEEISLDDIQQFLGALVQNRIMYREGNRFLSLAIHQP